MAPTLYGIPYSGPTRSVLLTAKAIGIEINLKLLSTFKREQFEESFLKINPQHTIPTLVDEDGFVIWDSHAIMAYLVTKYAKNDSLYPIKDVKKKAVVDQRLHFDSGVLFARGLAIFKPILRRETKEIPENLRESLIEGYNFLEKFLEDNTYVAGNEITIADFSIATSVTTWAILIPVEEKYVNINRWLKKIRELPYYNINQEGLDDFKAAIDERLSS